MVRITRTEPKTSGRTARMNHAIVITNCRRWVSQERFHLTMITNRRRWVTQERRTAFAPGGASGEESSAVLSIASDPASDRRPKRALGSFLGPVSNIAERIRRVSLRNSLSRSSLTVNLRSAMGVVHSPTDEVRDHQLIAQ